MLAMPHKEVLLDISVIIDFLRRKKKEQTVLYLLVEGDYDLSIFLITHTELYAGKSVWEKQRRAGSWKPFLRVWKYPISTKRFLKRPEKSELNTMWI